MPPEPFQKKILAWFDLHGRKNLPWQFQATPYKTWLSEVMLQQTQVSTVIPYYHRFIQRFPNFALLAEAPLDAVLQHWAGLGYYARARNLHKTAIIINNNDGFMPDDLDGLMALPGIGRSTAGAILSIAFNKSHPILDGNVRRVLARHHAISGWTGHPKISNELWKISTDYTPKLRCADYTQAMMDLGATLCTRSKPKCKACPVESTCIAKMEDKVKLLPTPKPRKVLPIKKALFLMLKDEQQQIFLEKRPETGIWGGLWSLPEFESLSAIKALCEQNSFIINSITQFDEQRHTFSHYHLDYIPIVVKIEKPADKIMDANQSTWCKIEKINSLGLAAPIKKLIQTKL